MDTLNKVLHPKQTLHKTDDDTDFAGTQTPPQPPAAESTTTTTTTTTTTEDEMRPNQQTREALTSEPNVTGTDRPAPKEDYPFHAHEQQQQQQQEEEEEAKPKISRGHHHPRQPVGATGLPPNHK
ncbi:hypothetical protein VP1G_06656 [Cytospora mali]|uniref:Uncharacterized protein n=1 Tax=Cytospora mali TaxID=578113 RepID=A0A194V665_CYTMA|nr:hypothetical protein VP1G_06656 [Valsa mali var. pyri (nom. inval.)]